MKLVAVSGGVDSMLLANKYKDKNIVLAFVNYNVRNDTHIDEKIVTDFAKKNNLKLEKLILKGKDHEKNFENWAREKRYDFFQKIYYKYNCNELLVAHHKDDFLETCIMQEKKNKNKLYYGIRKHTSFKKMKINRPFLFKYWKDEIYELAKKENVAYNDDYTNFDNNYERNKIRNNVLKQKSVSEKEKLLNHYQEINRKNKTILSSIKNEYKIWKQNKFSLEEFRMLKHQGELVKLFVNKRFENINLNKRIIENIIKFLSTRENNRMFLLTGKNYLVKKNNKLFVKKSISL